MTAARQLKPEDFSVTHHQVEVVEETESYIVIDNFLSAEQFQQMWNYFQVEVYTRVDAQGFDGKWLLEDGAAMRGPTIGYGEKRHAQFPTGAAIDSVMQGILDNSHLFANLIGERPRDWDHFTAFPSLYPRHTGLLWHRDAEVNQGSYTFYGHPYWNIEWGGELLLADLDPKSIPTDWGTFMKKPEKLVGAPHGEMTWSNHLDNSQANQILLERGVGYYVMPKPNRLAVIKGGTPHAVCKVREAAGNAVRASVSGFFKKTTRAKPLSWLS